jgi:hypothetical protein
MFHSYVAVYQRAMSTNVYQDISSTQRLARLARPAPWHHGCRVADIRAAEGTELRSDLQLPAILNRLGVHPES